MAYPLRPAGGIELRDRAFVATDSEPWLEILELPVQKLAGHYVEWRYRSGLLDEPTRPIFRFVSDDGHGSERIAPGAIVGAAVWIGRVPAGTTRVLVSPTTRQGPVHFEILSVRRRSWLDLLRDGLALGRRSARSAVLTKLIGWHAEADNNLDWAIGATPLPGSSAWWRMHLRSFDKDFDGSSAQDGEGAIIVDARGASEQALNLSLRSIASQHGAAWSAFILLRSGKEQDSLDGCSARLAALPPSVPVGRIEAGTILVPHALAHVAGQAARWPASAGFYADEWREGRPVFKPGWSPRLQAARPYLGQGVFLRAGTLSEPAARTAFLTYGELPASLMRSGTLKPLRRLLVEAPTPLPTQLSTRPTSAAVRSGRSGSAAIVVPTKNNPVMLDRLMESILAKGSTIPYSVTIVDNGSTSEAARASLARLSAASSVRIVDYPQPFNFSDMCNIAAAAAMADVYVFLNDDMEVLSASWLERLVDLALQEDIGAVGAKLTFPDGRLQHVGVTLGMGGSAGHFGAPAASDSPGWMNCNEVVHEVSAVTGACLAVARPKFLAVGGFDAEHLPIELSDIDLCLKLGEKGWQAVVDPAVHLMHEESASRGGATLRRLDVYEGQRAVFLRRWRHVLRDDPFFHPGLSLYSSVPALG